MITLLLSLRSGVRLCNGLDLKLSVLVGWERSSFVCCLVHRGLTDDLLLLQIFNGGVCQSRDLQQSRNTLYLLSPHFCFFIVLHRALFVIRDDQMFCTTSETAGEVGAAKLFEGGVWVMIEPVPRHCILVTFTEISGREIKVAEIISWPTQQKNVPDPRFESTNFWPRGYTSSSCSTQLSMKFKLFINIKIVKINGILRCRS